MQPFLVLCLFSVVLCSEPTFKAPDVFLASVKNRYIMKFKDKASMIKASSYIKSQAAKVSQFTLASLSSEQGVAQDQFTYGIANTYNSTYIPAVAVNLSEEDLSKVKKRYGKDIEYIEPDHIGYGGGVQQNVPSWGLARVGQWDPTGTNNYDYPDAGGAGVDAYVLDSGLMESHPSFGGRAKFLQNFVPGTGNNDVVGHGTHVGGTIGSSLYGVAKKANIYGVKVLDDNNNYMDSYVMAGIQFVIGRAKPGKTVINMSLYGSRSRALDDMVAAAHRAGIVSVICAGNKSDDACNYSPGASQYSLTVGATDRNDNVASFSNRGSCVKIFAPGDNIVSLSNRGNDSPTTMSGTSMAAPHVAGIVALYMSMKTYTDANSVFSDIQRFSHNCVRGAYGGGSTSLAYANARLQ